MTKEEAVRYLRSSGFSKEQIETVAAAFSSQTAADLISRQAAIDAIEEWGLIDGLSQGQAIEILSDHEKVPSVQPEIIACGEGELIAQTGFSEGLYVDGYNDGYRDGWKDGQEALRKEMWDDEQDRLD